VAAGVSEVLIATKLFRPDPWHPTVHRERLHSLLRRLDMAGSDVLRDVLPDFVNEVVLSDSPLILVLDDYYLISSRQVHDSVTTLLDRCPPQLHLIMVTRADPPLPVSRLRVRGQLAEIRAEQLRFSLGEAREFFDGRLDAALSDRDVYRLLARTRRVPVRNVAAARGTKLP
jgi:LuxR family transcriptional regulator, maltose regulon positive regulatory protein